MSNEHREAVNMAAGRQIMAARLGASGYDQAQVRGQKLVGRGTDELVIDASSPRRLRLVLVDARGLESERWLTLTATGGVAVSGRRG